MNRKKLKLFYHDVLDKLAERYPRFLEENMGIYKVLHTFEDKIPLVEALLEKEILLGVSFKKSSSLSQLSIATKIESLHAERGLRVQKPDSTYSEIPFHIDSIARNRKFILGDHGCLLYTSPSPRD